MGMVKSDGNGSLIVPNWFLAVACIIITLISCVAGVVAANTNLRNDVDHLMKNYDKASVRHTQVIDQIESKVGDLEIDSSSCQTRISTVENEITMIRQNLNEIKRDIKELLRQGG